MLLKSFSINKYRSIFRIDKLDVSSTLTTIIGKNNQGKSNILKAINLVFDTINYVSELSLSKAIPWRREIRYDWNNDFPIQKRNKRNKQDSEISIEIFLDEKEKEELTNELSISLTSLLTVKVIYGKEQDYIPNMEMSFRGISKKYFLESDTNDVVEKTCVWLSKKINFQYIPAIRTDELADNIANNIISLELSQLAPQKREKLQSALKQIAELQKPILSKLEKNLSATLKDFVPEIKQVSLKEKNSPYRMRRYNEESGFYINIDDGSNTILSQKGDGIKSLITLGMMRQKGKSKIGKGLILAIEEPESHLHPEAIRQISRVINDISEKNQIIITSHSPLFVNRNSVFDNIIVENNTATKAKNMKQIRDILGVIASDNLINSEFIIVVEGETDKIVLCDYFCKKSEYIKTLIEEKRLCFEVLNGVSNLENTLNKLNNMSSKYFCILDSDAIAKSIVKKVKGKALVSKEEKEVSYYSIIGNKETELEDLINPNVYSAYFLDKFNINILDSSIIYSNDKKWTKRIQKIFEDNGKKYSEDDLKSVINEIKIYISKNACLHDDLLINKREHSMNNILKQIENYFSNKGHQ